MITNTDKTKSLYSSLLDTYGIEVFSDSYKPAHLSEEYVQSLIDAHTLEVSKAWWINAIRVKAKALRDAVVSSYSAGEMATWPIKEAEAKVYVDEAQASSTCPLLYAEAQARQTTTAIIRDRVLANAVVFRAIEAAISGNAGRLIDEINSCSTFSAIESVDINSGWPN